MGNFFFLFTRPDEGQWVKAKDRIVSWLDDDDNVAARYREEIYQDLIGVMPMRYPKHGPPYQPLPTKSDVSRVMDKRRDTHHFTRRDVAPNRNHVHFTNGIYLLDTGEFIWREIGACPTGAIQVTHDEEHKRHKQFKMTSDDPDRYFKLYTRSVMPHEYDPDMVLLEGIQPLVEEFDAWLKLLLETDEQIQTWWEWLGYSLTWDVSLKKAMLFHGPTHSGKTALSKFTEWMLGGEGAGRVTAFTLRFITEKAGEAFAMMEGANVNIEDEMDRSTLRSIAAFKELTGGREYTTARAIYQTPYLATITTRFQANANTLPLVKELSDPISGPAFAGRWCVLFFKHVFTEDERDVQYVERFKCEEFASIVIHRALKAYHELRKRGYFKGMDKETVLEWWRLETDPVSKFLKEACKIDKSRTHSTCTTSDVLFEAFTEWLDVEGVSTGRHGISQSEFTTQMKTLGYPKRKTTEGGRDGKQIYVYAGVVLKEPTTDEDGTPTFDPDIEITGRHGTHSRDLVAVKNAIKASTGLTMAELLRVDVDDLAGALIELVEQGHIVRDENDVYHHVEANQ